jgi:23S rRNA (guanosine2251-2'-O)-methyltransferase
LATQEARERHRTELAGREAEAATVASISALLPAGAVHQGLAILAKPLESLELSEACEPKAQGRSIVLVLDQVTDPRNVGAILRSAAAFGVQAVVSTEAHAPPESGVLAKAASGALERVPFIRVPNLARVLGTLAELGYWRVGLDSAATDVLKAEKHTGAVALVLGAEGVGMRRLTAEHCDFRARLATSPVAGATGSLNVSVAASVALYELLSAPQLTD